MTDRAYIISRTLETKIAMAENNNQNTMLVTLGALKEILVLLKEQEEQSVLSNRVCEVEPFRYVRKGFCPKCHKEMEWLFNRKYCGFCGQAVKWEE